MKERGKSVEIEHQNTYFFQDSNYFSSSSDLPCKKHPFSSSSVGVCPYCLNDKLMNLVCSDCGEQRLSNCSCSYVSSYRNSYCSVDVGSVGRISFLIENEKNSNGDDQQKTLLSFMKRAKKSDIETDDDVVLLKRSSSCAVEAKKSNGFWKIGKLFKKRREKELERCSERSRSGFDHGEVCAMDVSRSRSLSSFMDGNFDDDGGAMACSSAKVSGFNGFEPRKIGFRGGSMDFESGFSVREADFISMDDDDEDSEFIDLRIDLLDKSTTEKSSCRITLNERGIKKVKNSHTKAWRGIFPHHSEKKDLNHILES